MKSSDRESSTEIHVREEGARRQEWKKNRGNERGIRGEDTNPGGAKREVDARLTAVGERERNSGNTRGKESGNKRGPNVVVTGDVALPDDISLRNYLSVQRDSARRLAVLMPADNVPIVS